MKYYPKGNSITDVDTSFVTVSGQNTSQFLFVFVWFDSLNSSSSLTGNVYAYSPLASYNVTVNIQQTLFPATTFTYLLYKNTEQQDSSQVASSSNMLSFPISTSTNLSPLAYNLIYQQTAATDLNNLYSKERI